MAISRHVIPDRVTNESSPIHYVTQNGFSLIRLGEIDGSVTDTAGECHFLVSNERGREREVTVHFEESLIAQIQSRRRIRLLAASVLWLVCAEKCLATYLWENDDYPDGGRLNVGALPVDELLLATHWNDQQHQ